MADQDEGKALDQGATSSTDVDATDTDLNAKSTTELKEMASKAKIKGRSQMDHDELVAALSSATNVATIPPHQWPPREGGVSGEEGGPEDDPALASGLASLHRAAKRDRAYDSFGPEAS